MLSAFAAERSEVRLAGTRMRAATLVLECASRLIEVPGTAEDPPDTVG